MATDFENGFTRRQMAGIAATGALTLGLSACSKSSEAYETSASKALDSAAIPTIVNIFKELGLDNFGDDPHLPPPVKSPAFSPKYSIIVHITSKGAWDLKINHAHFSNTKTTIDERDFLAAQIIANKISNKHPRFRDQAESGDFKPLPKNGSKNELADYLNFYLFGCSNQHDIYVFFDHINKLQFVNNPKYQALFVFGKTRKDGSVLSRNSSFYNASVIDLSSIQKSHPELSGNLNGTLLRIENHFTKRKNPLDEKSDNITIPYNETIYYKLNIPYIVNASSGFEGNVMIIDPDTGNGTGYDP